MNTTICADLTKAVGFTPLVRLQRLATGTELLAKVESMNPLGSIKDRVAVAMVDDAQQRGILQPGGTIVEPTSGNTGIGLAFVSASRGYHLILTMPESMSIERRKLLIHLGAELVLTPAAEGMKGAIARAREIQQQMTGAWMPDQFANPANPAMHRRTTGPEIWQQCEGRIDAFVAGVGTGGTISGAGGYLKERNPALHIVAVEPAASPVLSGGAPGPHKIQGIGAGFVPDNLDRSVIDEIMTVDNEEAIRQAQTLARTEGILCGISCGAALAGALRLAERAEFQGKRIVVILPDTGERYLSTDLLA
ncbi:MAG: cysteine synthase A [Desulfobulbaceae bacterium]|jgi:cysteine synthase A|nr:cysteine synthase A [Desulfobulbaceae bacterium]